MGKGQGREPADTAPVRSRARYPTQCLAAQPCGVFEARSCARSRPSRRSRWRMIRPEAMTTLAPMRTGQSGNSAKNRYRSRHLSLPSEGPGRDHEAGQLHEPDAGGGCMTDTPQVLLQRHLKKLRLPSFNSEYAKRSGNARPRARITRNICCGSAPQQPPFVMISTSAMSTCLGTCLSLLVQARVSGRKWGQLTKDIFVAAIMNIRTEVGMTQMQGRLVPPHTMRLAMYFISRYSSRP